MLTYEPSGFGDHKIRATFQWEKFKVTAEGSMGGNCTGFSIMESILDDIVYEFFPEDEDYCTVLMTADDGDECECEFFSTEELKNALVSIEIIDWQPEAATQ